MYANINLGCYAACCFCTLFSVHCEFCCLNSIVVHEYIDPEERAELWNCGEEGVLQCLHSLVTSVWDQKKMPSILNIGIVCPIIKKGDKQLCSNYSGILECGLQHSNILVKRHSPFIEKILG